MFCPKCGVANADNSRNCAQCGTELRVEVVSVPNYLIPSILTTLCCCLPFGIVAIVYAAQVNSKLAGGDAEGAKAASRKAHIWCWVSFGCGLLVVALQILIAVLGN